jgi:hypothetical protein
MHQKNEREARMALISTNGRPFSNFFFVFYSFQPVYTFHVHSFYSTYATGTGHYYKKDLLGE